MYYDAPLKIDSSGVLTAIAAYPVENAIVCACFWPSDAMADPVV